MSGRSLLTDKVCIECGLSWPATTTYYHKSKDGFHARCRKCRNSKLRGERKKKSNSKLDEIEKGAVKLFVASARLGGANIPHSSELLEVLMEYFGGVRGFANAYMKQYFDAPVGGAFRTKMLDSMVRLVTNNTAMGGAKKPLDLMSEDELEAELRRQVMEAAMQIKKVEVVDAVRNLPSLAQGESDAVGGVQKIPADLAEKRGGSLPKDVIEQQLRGME
jgi:hypothetical protein